MFFASHLVSHPQSKYRDAPTPEIQNTRLGPAITIKLLFQLYYFIIPYHKLQFSAYLAHHFEIIVPLYCCQTLISYNHDFIILLSQVDNFMVLPQSSPIALSMLTESIHEEVRVDREVHHRSTKLFLYQSFADLKEKRLHNEQADLDRISFGKTVRYTDHKKTILSETIT